MTQDPIEYDYKTFENVRGSIGRCMHELHAYSIEPSRESNMIHRHADGPPHKLHVHNAR
jgi:hypothetical protein